MRRAARTKGQRLAPLVQIILICAVTYFGLFAILYSGITPEQYDIQVGAPAPTQIKATKDIQDTVTTEALREAAANAVEPSYKSADPSVVNDVLSDLEGQFGTLRELRDTTTAETARTMSSSDLAQINESSSLTLTQDSLVTLCETDSDTLERIFTDAAEDVREVLISTLPEGQESAAVKSIRTELAKSYSDQLTELVSEVVRACLRPNMLIDEEITESNRQKARDDVQTVWYVKDQVIVGEGEIVTQSQYTMIAALGILDENTFDVRLLSGIALLIALVMVSTGFYLYQFSRTILTTPKQMTLLCLIMLLVIGLSMGFRLIHSYLMPVSLGLLLVVVLVDSRLALFINLMLSLLASVLAPAGSGMFALMLMNALCAPVIVSLYAHKTLRTTTLLAGVIIGIVNFLITLAVGMVNSAEMYDVLVNAGVAAGSGIISAVLCIGIQPLLEWLFNLATSSKLIELSNPNQPLLRRLLLEASGTYHHSIIVANLAEAACSAIGANGLLARVGAYYHDIGKLKRPMYFKENQMGDNPHDRTDPRVSTAILTAHTRDGAQMAQKARIPEPVVEIIRQHHGDGPVLYFYDKAQKLYGDQVDISAFRYEGPRPQSREAAVVMLADTIEAATRALPNPDPEKIDALIRKLVRGKLNDGQLDSSSLTFNDLDKICSAFSTVLTGVFHERIEYPDINIPPRLDKPVVPTAEEKSAEAAKAGAPSADAAKQPASPAGQPTPPVKPASAEPVKPTPAESPKVSAGQPASPVNPTEPSRSASDQPANSAAPAPVKSVSPAKPDESSEAAKHAIGQASPKTDPPKPPVYAGQAVAPVREEDDQRGDAFDD